MRARAKAIRAEAKAQIGDWAGAAIATRFFTADQTGAGPADGMCPGTCVSGYSPIGTEVDALPLMAALHALGATVCLPMIKPDGGALTFRTWQPAMALEPHCFGTAAPPEAASVAVRPTLLLVPLLAFDRQGGRLGYGQGHYDRTLAALRRDGPITAVGLAFSAQALDRVPMEGHDVPLDWIVTEAAVLRCRPD